MRRFALAVQTKGAAPFPPGGAQAPGQPPVPAAPSQDPAQDAQDANEEVQTHEWAGDLIENPDEASDPAEAFALFKGQEGEEAWLDRADDGTLTGWVRDADGSIYRYSDTDAWAVDVDDAGMARTDPGAEDTEEQDPDAEEEDAEPTPDDESAETDPAAGGGQQQSFFGNVQGKRLVLRALRTS